VATSRDAPKGLPVLEIPGSEERLTTAPSAVPFQCDVIYDGDHAVVAVRGEVDLATAPVVLREIRATLALPISGVTVDLAYVSFLDSTGVQAFITARNDAIERGIAFRLDSVPGQVRGVLELCDLLGLFGLTSRRDASAPPSTAA
jgi:anti-anti-sigma factor